MGRSSLGWNSAQSPHTPFRKLYIGLPTQAAGWVGPLLIVVGIRTATHQFDGEAEIKDLGLEAAAVRPSALEHHVARLMSRKAGRNQHWVHLSRSAAEGRAGQLAH